ncbi:signal peptidase I [Streptomyces nogalater]
MEGRSRFAWAARLADRLPGGRLTLALLTGLAFLLVLNAFVVQPFQIPSGSMEQGLRIGDRVLVNKLAYRFGAQPRRGDVIVFDGTGYFGDADYVKRVVGVGETMWSAATSGEDRGERPPGRRDRVPLPGGQRLRRALRRRRPPGRLFVLGDHRSDSSDSRDHLGSPGGGMIPVGDVIGRADWILWPYRHWTHLTRPAAYARVPDAPAEGGHG